MMARERKNPEEPFAPKKYLNINGHRMAYIDEGEGDAIVFQHGNPSSSYLWRNILPHLEGQGRLIACDLIGMGDSEKLSPSGPDRYHYEEQRDHLFALWDKLDLGNRVVLVIHDWGSALGFDWTMQHPDRVQGIAYMEAIVAPMLWSEWAEPLRSLFQGFRSDQGEAMVLEENRFVEMAVRSTLRTMSGAEIAEWRRPYLNPGEDRRPTLTWPRNIPIDGEPETTVRIAQTYADFLAKSPIPKLFVNAEPGAILTGRLREFCRTWPNQTEVTVKGVHFVQEDSPREIGEAVSRFVRTLREG
jgi:haloalkane dehalogenase